MAIRTLSLKAPNSQKAVQLLKEKLDGFNPIFILFFASGDYAPSHPAEELKRAFPKSQVIGCTSHSEFCNDQFQFGTISVMAADRDSIEDVHVEILENLKSQDQIREPINSLHNHFGGFEKIFNSFEKYVGIVLFESSPKAEEHIMEKLGAATDVLFVGGTSSSTENNISQVYANGIVYEDAAVLALLKTKKGYQIIKTQSAEIFAQKPLVVTKTDMPGRILYEFDGRPCGEAYADVLGVPVSDIDKYFVSNPLGVIAGDEIFIRTFNQIVGNGISLHCGLPLGAEIHVLKIGDIVADTKAALDETIKLTTPEGDSAGKSSAGNHPAGVINFNCLYRTLEMQAKHVEKEYSALFGRYPSIGFSTSGEAFLGHINETSTVLVIE